MAFGWAVIAAHGKRLRGTRWLLVRRLVCMYGGSNTFKHDLDDIARAPSALPFRALPVHVRKGSQEAKIIDIYVFF